MDINMPSRLNRRTISQLLNQVVSDDGKPLHDEYTFNFNQVQKFIEPIAVTFLHNLTNWLNKNEIKVIFNISGNKSVLSDTNQPQRFLDDCGFFEKHLGEKIYEGSSLRSTTVPIQDVLMNNFPQWMQTSFVPWLMNSTNRSASELATFKVCIEEIFNNVRDHAEEDSSCVFAQHIPGQNNLIISIADMGVGIIDYIKSKDEYSHFTDEEALKSAVTLGFTTKSTPKNRGAGLDALIHNVVMNAGGTVYIYTNKGILISRQENGSLIHEYEAANHFYPGTHIEIEINLAQAEDLFDAQEEEFAW